MRKKVNLIKSRDFSVDLLRIIAIILVVLCHVCLPPINFDGSIDLGRLTISSIVGDGVAIFFIISGFFIFRNESYKKKIIKVVKSIIIPSIILITFSVIFSPFINSELSFTGCIKNTSHISLNVKNALTGILSFNAEIIPVSQHLWYVFTYITNYLYIPLLFLIFDDKNDKTELAKKMIIILGGLSLLIQTIEQFYVSPYGNIVQLPLVSIALYLVVIGKIIYDNLHRIKNNKKARYIGLFMYVFFNAVKIIAQYYTYKKNVANPFFLYWSSLPSIIDSIGLIIFVLSFNFNKGKILYHFGKLTFSIYLVHWMIIQKIVSMKYSDRLYNYLNVGSSKFINELLYTFVFAFIVLFISIIISEIISFIKELKKWKNLKN